MRGEMNREISSPSTTSMFAFLRIFDFLLASVPLRVVFCSGARHQKCSALHLPSKLYILMKMEDIACHPLFPRRPKVSLRMRAGEKVSNAPQLSAICSISISKIDGKLWTARPIHLNGCPTTCARPAAAHDRNHPKIDSHI